MQFPAVTLFVKTTVGALVPPVAYRRAPIVVGRREPPPNNSRGVEMPVC
jgi:hypothetical protein